MAHTAARSAEHTGIHRVAGGVPVSGTAAKSARKISAQRKRGMAARFRNFWFLTYSARNIPELAIRAAGNDSWIVLRAYLAQDRVDFSGGRRAHAGGYRVAFIFSHVVNLTAH